MTKIHETAIRTNPKRGVPKTPLLSLVNVDKVFGVDTVALRRFSLTVDEGDFLSLLGPSGCGKTTALRVIAGLIRPTSGKVHWSGEHSRGEIGYVFQEPTLMPWATVEDNVWLPLRLRGESRQEARGRIDDVLSLVGLSSFARHYPRELSSGMKMRVSIARAIVTRPKLILMDEPFAALDEITRFKLNDDLLDLKERIGCTIVFVTHSVFESVFLSNRVVVMAARPGRVSEEIAIDPDRARDDRFRTSAEYAALCRSVSAALQDAMGGVLAEGSGS